jgi:hypothetical protein
MPVPYSRRGFVAAGLGALGGGVLLPTAAAQPPAMPPAKPKDKPPRLDLDMVRDFVAAAHKDLDKVRAMLEKQPALVNATWDWGGGDWETALGGAAHTGRKPIAEYLLSKGARLDVFAAAMLGKLDVVRVAVTLFPGTEKVPGPHGIPLLAHAKAGKDDAAEVVKYLESLKTA